MAEYQLLAGDGCRRKLQNSRCSYVVDYALIASMGSAMSGYCGGVMSGAVLFIKKDLQISYIQEELLMGSLVLVSIVGGIIAGLLADIIGRKKSMLVAAIIVIAGCITMGLAPSFSVLLLGRLITGIGYGIPFVLVPLYIAEVSPTEVRGRFLSFPEIFVNSGILLGYISSFCLAELPAHINWRLMVGLGALPAIFLACGVFVIPESPRWLVLQGRIDDALSTLIDTSDHESEAEQRLNDIVLAANAGSKNTILGSGSAKLSTDPEQNEMVNSEESGVRLGTATHTHQILHVWLQLLWPTPNLRFILFLALGLQFFQQASGVSALMYYSPAIFGEAGSYSSLGELGATVMVGIAKVVFIAVATVFLDRLGRRPLLLISSVGMTASLLTLTLRFTVLEIVPKSFTVPNLPGYLTIAACCSFMAFFSVGFGPTCSLLPSELFPLRLRAQGMSLTTIWNRLLSGLVSLTFLTIIKVTGPAETFLVFAGIATVSVLFVYYFIPETKGKTLEELTRY
ncbi:hypothetical protein O6H91_Y181800 [Diphasiastrum complanatum]|nr:hypothetical protein O6H91_Y161200 [Diphasiastrum complanatum]KAJ7299670.1 hypothetical protein O6H91_Y181800 [Diphasiastrum complanatum]